MDESSCAPKLIAVRTSYPVPRTRTFALPHFRTPAPAVIRSDPCSSAAGRRFPRTRLHGEDRDRAGRVQAPPPAEPLEGGEEIRHPRRAPAPRGGGRGTQATAGAAG